MRVWCNFGASHRRSCKKTKREDMRVRKQRDSTEEKEIEEQGGGLAEKRSRNPKRRKGKAKQRKHPTMHAPDS